MIKEVYNPKGYILDDQWHDITITENNATFITMRMSNMHSFAYISLQKLPQISLWQEQNTEFGTGEVR